MIVNIVEGADFVGKSAVLNEKLPGTKPYHPDYKVFDLNYSRNLACLFGYSVVDYLATRPASELPDDLTFDRSMPSSYAYGEYYKSAETVPLALIQDFFQKLTKMSTEVTIYHVSHSDKNSAKRIYDNDPNHNDKLDKFDSFEDYWKFYKELESYYKTFYKWLHFKFNNIKIKHIHTVSTMDGSSVILTEMED